jgi:hypothetical protein
VEGDTKVEMRGAKGARFSLAFYAARPVFDPEVTGAVHRLLTARLPTWSATMRVTKSEHQRRGGSVSQTGLAAAIGLVAPPRLGHGHAVIKGATRELVVFLESSRSTLPPEGNRVSVEVVATEIEGRSVAAWARSFFEEAVLSLPVRYARAHLGQEFDAKNILSDGGETRAVANLLRGLPGLYWLNYFGEPYLRLFDKTRVLECPTPIIKQVGDGVLFGLGSEPTEWSTLTYQQAETRLLACIGRQYFLDKATPDRSAIAPEFRAENAAVGFQKR